MTCNYSFVGSLKTVTLDDLYSGSDLALRRLDEALVAIVDIEAPITMNTLKARLRDKVFCVGKISQKALDIIDAEIIKLGFKKTDNLFDTVLWPSDGIFDLDYVRINSNRAIYDIPYQELLLLCMDANLKGEELHRYLLSFFGYEVLTAKAKEYLEFVESKL